MPVTSWSTTAANNDDADLASGISWAENMNASAVNDSARAMMAVIKGDFANLLTTNGIQRFPNGLILQWGTSSHATLSDYTVTFPTAFTSAAINISATVYGNPAGTSLYQAHVDSATVNNFAIRIRLVTTGGTVAGAVATVQWMAIGY